MRKEKNDRIDSSTDSLRLVFVFLTFPLKKLWERRFLIWKFYLTVEGREEKKRIKLFPHKNCFLISQMRRIESIDIRNEDRRKYLRVHSTSKTLDFSPIFSNSG